ncbi:MAG: hypothetical protein MRK02_11605 [Candidatus Scalindua sp.]|nr:hypothetical protein [Candidatus Scalindua sp.]
MHKQIKSIFLWIKTYKHALRVIGGVFFFLALVAGIFWIAGIDIEPVAFFLGLLSSLFLASPSIAEYFMPDRKPVKDMTFSEILEFIPTTDAVNDWHGISKKWASEWFLKEDPRLRFRAKFIDDGIQNENFQAEWANCHPDKNASGVWHDLYYDGAFLDRIILVSVDGGRALIPPPEFESGKINRYKYHVAKIHDTINTLDEYIRRSKLELEDS